MKLLEPIQVGKMTLKNRIMFPPLTTGYEERDGSIGQKSLSFYERLAKGGAAPAGMYTVRIKSPPCCRTAGTGWHSLYSGKHSCHWPPPL